MSANPPPTLRQLAASLGLSKSTVQRALNGTIGILPETQARVLAAAKAAGYRRDPFFAALATRKKNRGHPSFPIHYLQGSPTIPGFRRGLDLFPELQKQGLRFGFDLQRVNLLEFSKWTAIPRILWQRGSRGFLLEMLDPVMHDLLRGFGRVPMVCCERQEGLDFHTVRFGVADRVRLCWHKLREAGYRRIGIAPFLHDPPLHDDLDRLGAALTVLHRDGGENPIPPLEALLVANPPDVYLSWLERHRPDAVISARTGLWWAHRGLPFAPRAFASLHASNFPNDSHIPGAAGDHDTLANEALHVLDRLIRHGETGLPTQSISTVVPPVWHEGDGIPPALPE